MVACDWSSSKGRLLYAEVLWIGLSAGVACLRAGECFLAGCMGVGLAFSKFVDCKERRDDSKVGIGFYMCLCGWWRQVVVGSKVGSNSMIITDREILGLEFVDSTKMGQRGR